VVSAPSQSQLRGIELWSFLYQVQRQSLLNQLTIECYFKRIFYFFIKILRASYRASDQFGGLLKNKSVISYVANNILIKKIKNPFKITLNR
jgi:hypothetical protein